MNNKWVTPKQLEEMFAIKQKTQAKKRIRGELPYSKLGGFVYYDLEKIYALLEDHAVRR
jgi:hypothetical protein